LKTSLEVGDATPHKRQVKGNKPCQKILRGWEKHLEAKTSPKKQNFVKELSVWPRETLVSVGVFVILRGLYVFFTE
jgi:hypothetical protein